MKNRPSALCKALFVPVLAVLLLPAAVSAQVRVLAVGDSITEGVLLGDSYRPEFADLLGFTGCSFEMVGSQGSSPDKHEGYSGYTADEILYGTGGANPSIQAMMTNANYGVPDVVLLHIGSNDMRKAKSISGTADEIELIIDEIQGENSNAAIFVANVIPWWGTLNSNPNITADVQSLGDEIESRINALGDPNVVLVNVRDGYTEPMMQSDEVHPNAAGEALIAEAFFDAYGLFYSCAQSPDWTAPRTYITTPTLNQTVSGTTTYAGHATDTGGSGFQAVDIAIYSTDQSAWYNFEDASFGGITDDHITDALLPNSTASNADWEIPLYLPSGSYELYALAIDNNGNDAYFDVNGNNLIPLWPVRTSFSVDNPPIEYCNGQLVTVNLEYGQSPTSGNDVILGSSGADVIVAMGGDDTICGLGGADDINGGRGFDWIDGGDGDDTLQGANDDDEIYGGNGVDTIYGGPADDLIHADAGDDFIWGNSGNDTIYGGTGVDNIVAGSGNDLIYTGSGGNVGTSVVVTGGAGDDEFYGGSDADELRGESGADIIRGGGGDDRLFGGAGEDSVYGQSGNDLVRGNGGADIVKGGSGDDQVDGLGGDDLLYGGDGADVINGSTGEDILYGETGDDTLHGGGGNDLLYGGVGSDSCNGAGGNADASFACETEMNVP